MPWRTEKHPTRTKKKNKNHSDKCYSVTGSGEWKVSITQGYALSNIVFDFKTSKMKKQLSLKVRFSQLEKKVWKGKFWDKRFTKIANFNFCVKVNQLLEWGYKCHIWRKCRTTSMLSTCCNVIFELARHVYESDVIY